MNLPLPIIKNNQLFNLRIQSDKFKKAQAELEDFLNNKKHLHTKTFAKDVMFSHELKANNQIEGYNDDVLLVKEVIEKRYTNKNSEQVKRILNLYHGYNYILREKEINKDTLQHLYQILSKGLIDENLIDKMGEYYRTTPVYILIKGNLDNYDLGVNESKIDEFMNAYFDFLNNYNYGDSITDEFIKSQILHFYFVYIHPFYDVNGRTSRTLAMWYLLNKKAYPYIIFNRGIAFHGSKYDQTIIDTKKYHDISYFINFMLSTVEEELEKEYIMENINNTSNSKLSSVDFQTLLYILSMKGLVTVTDYTSFYNHFHDKQKPKFIYETMINPLIQKGILKVVRTTNNTMFDNYSNEVIEINSSLLDYNSEEIKRLVRYK